MAFTQADIDTLKEAIATGASEVEFGTGTERRRMKFRSLSEMRSTLAQMIAEVSPARAQSTVTFAEHCRD